MTAAEFKRLTGYTDYQVKKLEDAGKLERTGNPKAKTVSYSDPSVQAHLKSELADLKKLRAADRTGGEDDPDTTLKIARANKAIHELLTAASLNIPLDVALNEQAEAMIELRSELTGLPRVLSLIMPKSKRRATIAAVRKELAIWLDDTAEKIKSKLSEAKAVRDEHFRILRSIEEAKLISKVEREIRREDDADADQ